jgi:hypothetical protein
VRFKSQALLDEAALAACMAYVDVNPILDNRTKIPAHTSIKYCCERAKKYAKSLPFELTDDLKLIELTGRCIIEDKRGYIEENQPVILNRLNISAENW